MGGAKGDRKERQPLTCNLVNNDLRWIVVQFSLCFQRSSPPSYQEGENDPSCNEQWAAYKM